MRHTCNSIVTLDSIKLLRILPFHEHMFRVVHSLSILRLRSKPSHNSVRSFARTAQIPTLASNLSADQIIQYTWIDSVENIASYESGGYHPVSIDQVIHGRYTIVDKLGYGGYSTVWLAKDGVTKSLVALKVGVSRPSPARREPEVLEALSAISSMVVHSGKNYDDLIPNVLDTFEVEGPNGTHRCYSMNLMQGDLRAASFSRLFPIRVARALAARLVLAVDYVHSRGYVHGGMSTTHPRWTIY